MKSQRVKYKYKANYAVTDATISRLESNDSEEIYHSLLDSKLELSGGVMSGMATIGVKKDYRVVNLKIGKREKNQAKEDTFWK